MGLVDEGFSSETQDFVDVFEQTRSDLVRDSVVQAALVTLGRGVSAPGIVRYPGRKVGAGQALAKGLKKPVKGTYREPFGGSLTIGRQLNEKNLLGRVRIGEKHKRMLNIYKQIRESPKTVSRMTSAMVRHYKRLGPYEANDYIAWLQEMAKKETRPLQKAVMDIMVGQHATSSIPGKQLVRWGPKRQIQHSSVYITPKGLGKRVRSLGDLLNPKRAKVFEDWRKVLRRSKEGDLLMVDPPYPGTSGYQGGFRDTEELGQVLLKAGERGARGLVWTSGKGKDLMKEIEFEPTGKVFRGGEEEFMGGFGAESEELLELLRPKGG